MKYKFAVPECSKIDVVYRVISRQTLASGILYPTPEVTFEIDNDVVLVESFAYDADAYLTARVEEPVAEVSSDSAF